MPEHSPAPWMYDGPPHNIHVVQADAPHMRVCFLTSNGPTEANARLIAAAPDMLAALKAADHTLSVHGKIDGDTPLHDRIQAAITAAERKGNQ